MWEGDIHGLRKREDVIDKEQKKKETELSERMKNRRRETSRGSSCLSLTFLVELPLSDCTSHKRVTQKVDAALL